MGREKEPQGRQLADEIANQVSEARRGGESLFIIAVPRKSWTADHLIRALRPTLPEPFRAPHHTVTSAAISGRKGKNSGRLPGEFELSEGGTLLLDDFAEFSKAAIDVLAEMLVTDEDLRQPGRTTPNRRVVVGILRLDDGDNAGARRRMENSAQVRSFHVRLIEYETAP